MLNNFILQDAYTRTRYIIFCVVLAGIYAFVFGFPAQLSALGIVVDALIVALLIFVEMVLLGSIFTYSRLEVLALHLSIVVQTMYAIIAIALLLGVESLVANCFFEDTWNLFRPTLIPRIFAISLMYCAFRLFFLYKKVTETDDLEIEEPVEQEDGVQTEKIERLTVRAGNKIKVIPVEELLYLKAEDDYVSVVTSEGHWLKSERLKDYERALPDNLFARVHRSYIVNVGKISKIERYGQKHLLILCNGESLRISATGYKILKEKLKL